MRTSHGERFCLDAADARLFRMMLGIQHENPHNIDISDPICDEFYHYFRDVARKNTLIYEEVFAALPSNRVRTVADMDGYNNGPKMKDTDPLQVGTYPMASKIVRFLW